MVFLTDLYNNMILSSYIYLVFVPLFAAQLDVWAWSFEHTWHFGRLIFIMYMFYFLVFCTYSVQFSLFHMERSSRNKIIIIIIIFF